MCGGEMVASSGNRVLVVWPVNKDSNNGDGGSVFMWNPCLCSDENK